MKEFEDFQPLLDLLQFQYGEISKQNEERFQSTHFETAIDQLLVPNSHNSPPPVQVSKITELTEPVKTKVQQVQDFYLSTLRTVPSHNESCLCLGILHQFSLRQRAEALKYYELVLAHITIPPFTKFVKMLIYSCKKHLAIKTTEIYQDILRWELSNKCQLVHLSKTFFEPINGAQPNAAFILGIAYHVVKEYDTAREYFQKSVIIEPKYCLGWRYLAGILRDHYRAFDLTKKIYDKVLEDVDPNCVQVHYNRGFLLKNEFEDYKQAQRCFEECIRLDSTHISAHNRLADLCVIFQNYKLAEDWAMKALEIDPEHFRSTVDLGHLYRKELNNRNLARHYYEKAILLRPNEHRVYASLGKLLRKSYYDYKEAKMYYQKALELAPMSSRTHLEMGNLLSKHFNDWENARKHYIMSMLVRGDYDKPYKSLKKGEQQHCPNSEIMTYINATGTAETFSVIFEDLHPEEMAVKLFDFPECFRRRAEMKFTEPYKSIISDIDSRKRVLLSSLETTMLRDTAELTVKFLLLSTEDF